MTLAPESRPFLLAAAVVTVATGFLAGWLWALVPGVVLLFIAYFFRDPQRTPPSGEGLVISPADGRIVDIQELDDPAFPDGRARRVSIFLSIFNVHVNRAPLAATVRQVRYSKGRFRAAFHGKASEENERNRVDLDTAYGPLAVTQIAGAIARRIVCDLNAGDRVRVGDRMGLIRFGSRVDIFLPLAAELQIRKGNKVATASTIIAHIPASSSAGRQHA